MALKSAVHRPSHYTAGAVECIDAIESAVSPLAGKEAFLTGQIFKYLWRWKLKGEALENLEKAQWYLTRLMNEVKRG